MTKIPSFQKVKKGDRRIFLTQNALKSVLKGAFRSFHNQFGGNRPTASQFPSKGPNSKKGKLP